MAGKSLYEKVWDAHTVSILSNGKTQLFIGTHLIHEVTSPQAFGMLRDLGLSVKYPERTFATVDHIVPTDQRVEPFADPLADAMIKELRKNCQENDVTMFDISTGKQGIVHMVGPEQGITQPGTTIACGDSHTSTHGAFGAIAFGIGTSQVRDVLATQTMSMDKMKVRRINVDGKLGPGVYAKDVILHIIKLLGVKGGLGYAYEYGGETFDSMSMEERMTVCNMSIEGGARCGYVNPDETTFEYLRGRPYAPKGEDWEAAVARWKGVASDADCVYDDVVNIDAADIEPSVTWGINPGQGIFINEPIPSVDSVPESEKDAVAQALAHMKFQGGEPIKGKRIDVAFFGSCTNARLTDFVEVAKYLKGRKVADGVKAIAVPGSQIVGKLCAWKWVSTKCSQMRVLNGVKRVARCALAMNPDKLIGDQLCASSSNRNFIGRQGSATGRTILMSPVMVAAAAVTGEVSDARDIFGVGEEAVA